MCEPVTAGEGHRISGFIGRMKHPVLTFLLIGLAIRLVAMSLAIVYDNNFWAIVVRNIESGEGLYNVEGYYYTPVWGYVLGLTSALQSLFLDLGETAIRVVEALPVEGVDGFFTTATIPSLAFIYSVKLPLVIADAILAFLVMVLVKDITGDEGRSKLAFGLTFLCPVLFGSTCIIGMPDTISAVFMVLTVILLRRGYEFVAGMTFAMAVLVKFFPVFLIFVFAAYVLARYRGDTRTAVVRLGSAMAGFLAVTFIIFLPQIMEGDLSQCFLFLTDRSFSEPGESVLNWIIDKSRVMVYAFVILMSLWLSVRMYRSEEGELDDRFMTACLAVVALTMLYPPTTQYLVVLVPFLAYWASGPHKVLRISWIVLAVGSLIYMFSTNATIFMPLSVWGGLFDIETLTAIFEAYSAPLVGGITAMHLQFGIGGVMQCASVLMVLYFLFGDTVKRFIGGIRR